MGIEDEALSRFAQSREFDDIVSFQRKDWARWVRAKIDQEDFRDLVLKFEKPGQVEINLSEMEEKLKFEYERAGIEMFDLLLYREGDLICLGRPPLPGRMGIIMS